MALERQRIGQQVVLFAPAASLKRIQRVIPCTTGLVVRDFSTYTTPSRIRQGLPEAVEWLARLPTLDHFDTVICDNHPEILSCRPDSIISAQFFWHDVIEDASHEYSDYCEYLLAHHRPKVIGCDIFAMEAVRRQPGFKPVGLYKNPDLVTAVEATLLHNRSSLLLTGGSTDTVRDQLQKLIVDLLVTGPGIYDRIYVDQELMPQNPPSWMSIADFSVEMYCKIGAAICRPGLGVATDLITTGATIYPLHEPSNREMSHNASILRFIQKQSSYSHQTCSQATYVAESY